MQIKTKNGIAESMPLSDIQRNNQLLNKLIYLGWAALVYIIFMTLYIMYYNVIGNIITKCVC